MATWEYQAHLFEPPEEAIASPQSTSTSVRWWATVVSLIVVIVGTAPYWANQVPLGTQEVSAPSTVAQEPNKAPEVRRPPAQIPQAAKSRKTSIQVGQARPRVARAKKYVVSFGSFPHQITAETQAKAIRAKGYHAVVTHTGGSFHVLSRAFQDRASAEFWSKVYGEIGLKTRVLTVGTGAVEIMTEIALRFTI